MAQSGWRLPDDLLKRVRVHCAETGERQNEFVRRALEMALNGGPSITIDASVINAAPTSGCGLKFSPEEEAAHREAERRAIARQFVSDPKPAAKKTAAKKPPAELPRIAPRHWGKS
jgi:plasmid stability protein